MSINWISNYGQGTHLLGYKEILNNVLRIVFKFQLTVIHPRVPTPKASPAPTEPPVQNEDMPVVAHLQQSVQHVKSPVHTIVDHYLEAKMSDKAHAVVAPASELKV